MKYHMVNVFNFYREAARKRSEMDSVNDRIDQTSTMDLFFAPYRPDVLLNPWVFAKRTLPTRPFFLVFD